MFLPLFITQKGLPSTVDILWFISYTVVVHQWRTGEGRGVRGGASLPKFQKHEYGGNDLRSVARKDGVNPATPPKRPESGSRLAPVFLVYI